MARKVLAAVGVVLLLAVSAQLLRNGRGAAQSGAAPPAVTTAIAGDAQARCDDAIALVTARERWPMTCRWRQATDGLQGQAFPPPPGVSPFGEPHIEVYVEPAESREDVARAIAHELGHMHHTREFPLVAEWLAARNLPPETPVEVWSEDYAEVFAALFAPPSDKWRAPTVRPAPDALAGLRTRFFAGA